ncbi:basic amino acid ABC transporter substrate-binding protein [Gracilibacillus caseinilyticus]|uniref:Basic amino acid ABC transporter substrate-binding protein n=1 Tax=Gracilibacillus caseinilyticus TaxID=2932256 RepID=A0ABY4F6C9_9BACI|nr:basic amino acid ABC transporter substrate-binding protein [Gracilibacillus caseinilyticus]UOQ50006.1 basic amino acid ABC transporter substrate-binding protein [Gracilibacillus caseinilyticus]
MNKWIKGFAALLLTVLVACGTDDSAEQTNGSDKPTLKVVTEAGFMPFTYLDKGEVVGFDIDLLAAVMEEAGYNYELENVGWDAMLLSVEQGDADLAIAGVTVNDERKQSYDFSSPYFESTHKIIFRSGENITSGQDIKDLKVGVQSGTTGAEAVEKILGKNADNISKYDSNTLALTSLQSGDVDAVVTDNVVADEYVANNPEADVEMISDPETFESEYYGIMFPKGSDIKKDIDAALQTLIENGTYADIYKEWFGVEPDTAALEQ